jgi:hypothetical protein
MTTKSFCVFVCMTIRVEHGFKRSKTICLEHHRVREGEGESESKKKQ